MDKELKRYFEEVIALEKNVYTQKATLAAMDQKIASLGYYRKLAVLCVPSYRLRGAVRNLLAPLSAVKPPTKEFSGKLSGTIRHRTARCELCLCEGRTDAVCDSAAGDHARYDRTYA